MLRRRFLPSLASMASIAFLSIGCASAPDEVEDPEAGTGFEGVEDDLDTVMDDGKSDLPRYATPTNLPTLISPEIIVSLDGLTVHLFDRATGFQAVYPAGVGVKNSNGRSITPTGHFASGPDASDSWWYVPRRTNPEHFGGFPFLRLTAENSVGANTYALHGPITQKLIRGYVSHGCVRMAAQNVIDLFTMVKTHTDTPVTIQREVELDAKGAQVDVGKTPALWDVGEPITFGNSVGPRD